MKALLILLLPLSLMSQQARQSVEPLKVEWQKELDIPGSGLEGINGLILDSRQNLCVISNQSGTKVFGFNDKTEPVEIYSISSYLGWVEPYSNNFIARESNCVTEHDFNTGTIIEKNCYQMPPDWATTSPVSKMYENEFYYAGNYFLCKFKKNGEVVFKKEVAQSGNSNFIQAAGGCIYLYGRYNTLSDTRLMQYDTLGNQKWSLPTGDVRNMIADADGNCYILVANGETTIVKYGPDGKEIWSKNTPGQWSQGSFMLGDSLFVCGNISPGAMTDNKMPCAYSIISAKTGAVISQQTITISEDKNTFEHFSQIACDGKNIYIGGSVGNQYPKCFLVKLSKEGNTTGIQESKATKSFEIFPNPGGSRFTISCENQRVNALHITVRNISGQVVYKKEVACNENLPAGKAGKSYTLDLGKQASGTYTVEIVSGKDRTVKKVVVE